MEGGQRKKGKEHQVEVKMEEGGGHRVKTKRSRDRRTAGETGVN